MTKIRITQKEKNISELEEKLRDFPILFVTKEEIEKNEFEILHAGHEPAIIDVLGNKVGVIMKQELRGALIDPSADDLDILTTAANIYFDYASKKYGEKAKIPAETSFGRFVEEAKINSLIMNIYKFPTNELNIEKLSLYGLDNKEVIELANKAYQTFCQTTGSLDIGSGTSFLSSIGGGNLESKTYSGSTDTVDLSSDVCHAGSHYKLNLKIEKLQEKIQKDAIILSKEYLSYEKEAVRMMMQHNPSLTEQTATNLFRMFINLGGAYKQNKALPIK